MRLDSEWLFWKGIGFDIVAEFRGVRGDRGTEFRSGGAIGSRARKAVLWSIGFPKDSVIDL